MAKGRRLSSTHQSDRFLGFGNYNYGHDHHHHHDEPEFGEEEVWSMVEDHRAHHHQRGSYGGEWSSRAAPENRRRHAQHHQVGGLSLAFDGNTTSSSSMIMHQFTGNGGGPRGGRHVAASAPVNVPDWGKVTRFNSSAESMQDSDEDGGVGDSGMEPPHEYLARSRKINARSVYEGVGRTLKGRDMSRVRDEVWSQTGFEG